MPSLLLAKAEKGDVDGIIEQLEEEGVDVNEQEKDTWLTPLHKACLGGHIEAAKILIEKGADLNKGDVRDNTPLHTACDVYRDDTTGDFCWEDMIDLLVEKGAFALNNMDKKLPDPGEDAVTRVTNAIEKATKDGKEMRKKHDAESAARKRDKIDKIFEEKLVEHISSASAATVAVRESPSRPDGWG